MSGTSSPSSRPTPARTQSRSRCARRSSTRPSMAAEPDREQAEQVLAAEQDERRRIALFLHDGPVQSLSGVALMLDASLDLIRRGEHEQAREILDRALARTSGREHRIEVTLDVALIDALAEQTQAALYQIVREALEEAIRRGPPSRFEVVASAAVPGTLRLVIRDDAPTERRRRALEVLGERARTLGATLTLDHEVDGTTMSLELRGQPTGDD